MMPGNSALSTIDEVLEAQYALRQRHPERGEIYLNHQQRSESFRALKNCELDLRYADGPRCLLDIFPAGKDAPVLFFVHGGYWRALDKSYVSFIAQPFQSKGITVVLPTYDLAPAVSVHEIVQQLRAAFGWAMRRLRPDRVVVAGHSAGGQLALMLAIDQIVAGAGPIVGVVGISGVYDLRPLLRTSVNNDLGLSADEAAAASPLLRLNKIAEGAKLMPLVGLVGSDETSGFKQWTKELVVAWQARKGSASYDEVVACNHFTVLDELAKIDGPMMKSVDRMLEF